MPKVSPEVSVPQAKPMRESGTCSETKTQAPGTSPPTAAPCSTRSSNKQERRGDADAGMGRQQAHQQGRHRHQQHAEHEHALAPDAVAEVRHDDAAERSRQIAGGEDAEGLQLAQPFGHVRRKEQLRDDRREEDEDDEVVELERAAERG